ncbi:MAG: hypothetical protein ABSC19_01075 [Syntrophorhabdales bacterium]
MKRVALILAFLLPPLSAAFAGAQIDLLPPSVYDRSIIYLNLAFFWIGIIVLIVLLRLKLREIERVQTMEQKEDDGEIASLD